MKRKQIVNCAALEQCELLLCGDCVGLVPSMHFIFVWGFGITYCSAHLLKPWNPCPISMSAHMDRRFGLWDCDGCGCRLGHQCIVKVVLKILERVEWDYVSIKSTVMKKNWQKGLKKKGAKSVYVESEWITESRLDWGVTPVLSIEVELVVRTSRHILYCLKPIRIKDDRQGAKDKCDKGL